MKKSFMRKQKPIQLELHKGCMGCSSNCLYNNPVTTKFKNQSASDDKYGCNTSKGKNEIFKRIFKTR